MTSKSIQPLKICMVFEEQASGHSAEILLKHVTSEHECETESFKFEELNLPPSCVAAARSAATADLLIIAVQDLSVLNRTEP